MLTADILFFPKKKQESQIARAQKHSTRRDYLYTIGNRQQKTSRRLHSVASLVAPPWVLLFRVPPQKGTPRQSVTQEDLGRSAGGGGLRGCPTTHTHRAVVKTKTHPRDAALPSLCAPAHPGHTRSRTYSTQRQQQPDAGRSPFEPHCSMLLLPKSKIKKLDLTLQLHFEKAEKKNSRPYVYPVSGSAKRTFRVAASRCACACPRPPLMCMSPGAPHARETRPPTRPTCWPSRGSGCTAAPAQPSNTNGGRRGKREGGEG